MYFDLEDYHPEEPRVGRAISAREGVLLSLIAHLIAVILIILAPKLGWWKPRVIPVPPPADPVRFVMLQQPALERANVLTPPGMDRRTTSNVKPPKPDNPMPASVGNTPERVVATKPDSPPPGDPTPPPPPNATVIPDIIQSQPSRPTGEAGLANSLHNLSSLLQNTQFNNPQGGNTDQNAAIQFDDKGVDFGPWLARFKAQVMSNWLIPQAAMVQHGHVVFQFWIARDGTITEIHIVQPSGVTVFNTAAQNALVRSNPTVPLPKEYPTDKVLFTVTFFYNEEIPHGAR